MSSTAMPRPLSAFLSSCAIAAEVLPIAAKRSASTSAACVATSSCVRSCTRCSSSAGRLAQLLIALLDRRLHAARTPRAASRSPRSPPARGAGGRGHALAARDPDRAGGQRLQRPRQVGRQQHAGDRRDHDAEQQDPAQRRPLLLEVRGQRPPGPGEDHRVAGPAARPASTRTAPSDRWPRRSASRCRRARRRRSPPPSPSRSAARAPVGRVDHLPARLASSSTSTASVSRGRFSCNVGAIRLSSPSAMTPTSAPAKRPAAHERLDDLQRAPQRSARR